MNPLDILLKENEVLRKDLIKLEEMTYSPSVNSRDFSFIFKSLIRFWDEHSSKEDKILRVLEQEGFNVFLENMRFRYGRLKELRDRILDAIKSGRDEDIKHVLKNDCCEIIDTLRAHIIASDDVLSSIEWSKLRNSAVERIQLLQIIPNDKIARFRK